MSSPLFNEKFRRPTVGFTELLKKGIGGLLRERDEYVPFMFRALVIAADTQGGRLETPDSSLSSTSFTQVVVDQTGRQLASYEIRPTRGPKNPKGSVRARIVSNNMDKFIDDDDLRTFWPLFPGVQSPSAGQLVYVVFEDEEMTHGLWLAKVPLDTESENSNQILMSSVLSEGRPGNRNLFPDMVPGTAPRDGSPIRPAGNRLTSLFINTQPRTNN